VTREIPTCKPPDPNTRRPRFRAPPRACDAHCHIFGPGAKYPYAPDRSYTPPDAPLEKFRELQAILGFERAVLVNASCHGTDNTVILDAIAQSNGQYRGVANADDSFSERDFQRLHDGGCRGVRFNFVRHLGGMPDLDEFQRVIERIRPFDWHVVLHLDAADVVEFDGLLKRLPIPFVIDHMGRVPTAGVWSRSRSGACWSSRGETTAGSRFAAQSAFRVRDRRSPMRYRLHRRSSMQRPTGSCGVPTGRIRTSRSTCRTTAISSISFRSWRRIRPCRSAYW